MADQALAGRGLLGRDIEVIPEADRAEVLALYQDYPQAYAPIIAQIHEVGLVGTSTFVGLRQHQQLQAVVNLNGNVMPVVRTGCQGTALWHALIPMPRRCAAIVGENGAVVDFWNVVRRSWGPARDERFGQILLAAATGAGAPVASALDPPVRGATKYVTDLRYAVMADLVALWQPSIDMFTQEVGVSPLVGTSAASYRARLATLIRNQRIVLCLDELGIVFKAELAAITNSTAQVQGVWVRPDRRNQGIGSFAMRQLRLLAADRAPNVSLYVNNYNLAALHSYQNAGFEPVHQVATIHF